MDPLGTPYTHTQAKLLDEAFVSMERKGDQGAAEEGSEDGAEEGSGKRPWAPVNVMGGNVHNL